jgi:excinuclease UvrABC nuclease subunit
VVGANDFASMAEILGRRFKRWENAGAPGEGGVSDDGASTPHPSPLPRGEGTGLVPRGPLSEAFDSPSGVQGQPAPAGGLGVSPTPLSTSSGGAAQKGAEPEPPDDEDGDGLLGWGALPDLVIVDGGKGQLSAALDVMRNLSLQAVPLAGLAKQNEELFVQDQADPIVLPRTSQALYLVQRIRDEAHRFAITYHRTVRAKTGMESALDSIPGIGPKRKRALLRKFGSLRGVREASVEDIASTLGFTLALANKVKEHL